jgi:hypothetical protein
MVVTTPGQWAQVVHLQGLVIGRRQPERDAVHARPPAQPLSHEGQDSGGVVPDGEAPGVSSAPGESLRAGHVRLAWQRGQVGFGTSSGFGPPWMNTSAQRIRRSHEHT